MSLREVAIDRWTLSECPWDSAFAAIRSECVTLAWTELEAVNGSVLNVLAPIDHIFWNLDAYQTFQHGHQIASAGVASQPSTLSALIESVREVGERERSIYSFVLLGGISRCFGDRFLPESLPSDYRTLAKRHHSFFVPSTCCGAVSRHFHELAVAFGESSARAARGSQEFVVTDSGRRRYPDEYCAFGKAPPLLSWHELESSVSFLKRLVDEGDDQQVLRRLVESTVVSGDVSVAVPAEIVGDDSFLSLMSELLALRANFAVEMLPSTVVERLLRELDGLGWRHRLLIDLRDQLRGRLLGHLAKHPSLLDDPFAEWQQTRTGTQSGSGLVLR